MDFDKAHNWNIVHSLKKPVYCVHPFDGDNNELFVASIEQQLAFPRINCVFVVGSMYVFVCKLSHRLIKTVNIYCGASHVCVSAGLPLSVCVVLSLGTKLKCSRFESRRRIWGGWSLYGGPRAISGAPPHSLDADRKRNESNSYISRGGQLWPRLWLGNFSHHRRLKHRSRSPIRVFF